MTTFVFANGATGALNAPISAGDTSLTLQSGQGALFPNPSGSQQFALTLTNKATGLINEIMYCTARSGDTLTVVRAQEGTSAVSWAAGDFANNYLTAGTAAAFLQTQATGVYYAADTGAANALVVTLSPVPANQAALLNIPIYITVAHTNTAAAPTLNANGLGAQTIAWKSTGGAATVPINALAIGAVIQVMWDGTRYQLLSIQPPPFINTLSDGYVQLPSGQIIQWGKVTLTGPTATITLDITFPTRGVSCVVQPLISTGGPLLVNSSFTSNSVITSALYEYSGGTFVAASTQDYHYIAIGN